MSISRTGRALQVTTPLETLRERRDAMHHQHERRARPVPAQFEFRANPDSAVGPTFRFNGYAATFEQPFEVWDGWGDPYSEILDARACTRTLANSADVQFLIGHDTTGIPLARTRSATMALSADSTGLHVSVPSLDGRSPQVQSLASAMERGDMDEMSIGFIAIAQQWSPDYMERRLTEISLNRGDVSIVCWAANPNAAGAAMTALPITEAAARAAGGGRERRTPTAPYSAKPGEDAECPQCHSMNDPAAAYCDQCGTAIQATATTATAQETQTQRCPCGSWNADDAKFCSTCGANISSDQDADNGGRGNGTADTGYGYGWANGRPVERRALPADGPQPDFTGKPAHDAAAHGEGSPQCPDPQCAAANASDAAYCDQCGQPLYDEGGLVASVGSMDDIVSDASGVVEEDDEQALSARQARVRVLSLTGRR